MTTPTTPSATSAALTQLLKAAGDELRLAILQVLARDSYGVLELAEAFDIRQSGLSHHLKVLAKAGLVSTRREGNSIFYQRAAVAPDDPFGRIKQAVLLEAEQLPLAAPYRAGLGRIWHERAEASQQFFLENADKFRAQQDLIASFSVYRQAVAELLQMTATPERQRALEIGPGEGEFLGELCARFDHVTALDNSQQMLAKAQAHAEEQQWQPIDFVHGDTSVLADFPAHFNLAVINMVLHHTPSPAQIFMDVGRALKPQGALLVTDLCLHDQTWAQRACGDLWLGFDPADLSRWAEAAGFNEGQSVYFALRNGFQIQIRQFFQP